MNYIESLRENDRKLMEEQNRLSGQMSSSGAVYPALQIDPNFRTEYPVSGAPSSQLFSEDYQQLKQLESNIPDPSRMTGSSGTMGSHFIPEIPQKQSLSLDSAPSQYEQSNTAYQNKLSQVQSNIGKQLEEMARVREFDSGPVKLHRMNSGDTAATKIADEYGIYNDEGVIRPEIMDTIKKGGVFENDGLTFMKDMGMMLVHAVEDDPSSLSEIIAKMSDGKAKVFQDGNNIILFVNGQPFNMGQEGLDDGDLINISSNLLSAIPLAKLPNLAGSLMGKLAIGTATGAAEELAREGVSVAFGKDEIDTGDVLLTGGLSLAGEAIPLLLGRTKNFITRHKNMAYGEANSSQAIALKEYTEDLEKEGIRGIAARAIPGFEKRIDNVFKYEKTRDSAMNIIRRESEDTAQALDRLVTSLKASDEFSLVARQSSETAQKTMRDMQVSMSDMYGKGLKKITADGMLPMDISDVIRNLDGFDEAVGNRGISLTKTSEFINDLKLPQKDILTEVPLGTKGSKMDLNTGKVYKNIKTTSTELTTADQISQALKYINDKIDVISTKVRKGDLDNNMLVNLKQYRNRFLDKVSNHFPDKEFEILNQKYKELANLRDDWASGSVGKLQDIDPTGKLVVDTIFSEDNIGDKRMLRGLKTYMVSLTKDAKEAIAYKYLSEKLRRSSLSKLSKNTISPSDYDMVDLPKKTLESIFDENSENALNLLVGENKHFMGKYKRLEKLLKYSEEGNRGIRGKFNITDDAANSAETRQMVAAATAGLLGKGMAYVPPYIGRYISNEKSLLYSKTMAKMLFDDRYTQHFLKLVNYNKKAASAKYIVDILEEASKQLIRETDTLTRDR